MGDKRLWIGVVAIAATIYWFAIRPSQIRERCANAAIAEAQSVARSTDSLYSEKGVYSTLVRDNSFRFCLQRAGLAD
jgi:hypothetical protein